MKVRLFISELLARGEDGVDGVAADVLDRGETEADGIAVWSEVGVGEAHIGRLDGDVHLAAFLDVLDDILWLRNFGCEQSSHELDGVVGLQIGGLVGHKRIGRGMRLVEAVSREFRHPIKYLGNFRLWVSQRRSTAHKPIPLLRHSFGILLPHRAAQQIRFAQGVARQHVGDAHDLFLINNHAQRIFQDALKLRQQEFNLSPPPLALDEVVDHIHGAGTIERVERCQVLDGIWLVTAQNVPHAG